MFINYIKDSERFLLLCGGSLGLIAFLLSFLGISGDGIYYYYYLLGFLFLVSMASLMFDFKNTMVFVTVVVVFHLIYVFFFAPDTKETPLIGDILFNIFLVLFFYGFAFFGFKIKNKLNSEKELLKTELKRLELKLEKMDLSNKKHNKRIHKRDDLMLEKKLQRYHEYLQVFEETMKLLLHKKERVVSNLLKIWQSKLGFEFGEIYYLDDENGWILLESYGKEVEKIDDITKKKMCSIVSDEKLPLSYDNSIIIKHRLTVSSKNGIIGIPINVSDKGNIVIMLYGFKEKAFINEDERFFLRIIMCINNRREA